MGLAQKSKNKSNGTVQYKKAPFFVMTRTSIAQMVQIVSPNLLVCGSSPGRGNKDIFSKKKFLINTPALLGFHESYSNKKSEEVIFFAIKIIYSSF